MQFEESHYEKFGADDTEIVELIRRLSVSVFRERGSWPLNDFDLTKRVCKRVSYKGSYKEATQKQSLFTVGNRNSEGISTQTAEDHFVFNVPDCCSENAVHRGNTFLRGCDVMDKVVLALYNKQDSRRFKVNSIPEVKFSICGVIKSEFIFSGVNGIKEQISSEKWD